MGCCLEKMYVAVIGGYLRQYDDPLPEDDEMVDEDIESRFSSASNFVGTSAGSIPSDLLLSLYGLYKQATAGNALQSHRPFLFDFAGRRKFNSWWSRRGMSRSDAMLAYSLLVQSLNMGWDPSTKNTQGFGIRMSRPMPEATEPDPVETTLWFVAAKGNDVDTVRRLLDENGSLLNEVDEYMQMTALHWAVDSGAEDVINLLLSRGVDVDCVDGEGSSALHFAVVTDRVDIASLLIAKGARTDLINVDGMIPADLAESPDMLVLFDR